MTYRLKREHVRWQHFSQKKDCPIGWFVQLKFYFFTLKMQQAKTVASAATSKLMVSHLKDGQPIAMVLHERLNRLLLAYCKRRNTRQSLNFHSRDEKMYVTPKPSTSGCNNSHFTNIANKWCVQSTYQHYFNLFVRVGDSNHGPLVSEATIRPTAPLPRPIML